MFETPSQFPAGETSWILSGPAGKLEVLSSCLNPNAIEKVAVICHPHPLFGGTMHNKVVYSIAKAFKEVGWAHLRFNFRGVGQSEGEYAAGVGETEDLMAVLAWVKTVAPNAAIYLAGFSFGAYVALCGAKQQTVARLILVAPAVKNFGFATVTAIESPCLVIQGEQDEIVPPQAVFDWINQLESPVKVARFPTAGHFFHGQLVELRQVIVDYIRDEHLSLNY